MNNEPVAWMRLTANKDTRISLEKFHNDDIPLYLYPVKELTDSEIMESCHAYHYTYNPDYLGFAREILRKAQEK
jgi:hypothetical protein